MCCQRNTVKMNPRAGRFRQCLYNRDFLRIICRFVLILLWKGLHHKQHACESGGIIILSHHSHGHDNFRINSAHK